MEILLLLYLNNYCDLMEISDHQADVIIIQQLPLTMYEYKILIHNLYSCMRKVVQI
jgi:hypothetical protein